jgi:hypothetical protein
MLTISKLRGVDGRLSRLLLVFVCTLWFVVVVQSSIDGSGSYNHSSQNYSSARQPSSVHPKQTSKAQ